MFYQRVNSSNIAEVGYDASVWVLEITFKSGETYQYAFVPPDVHAGLVGAASTGQYFHANVKPRYQFRKVEKTAKNEMPRPVNPVDGPTVDGALSRA